MSTASTNRRRFLQLAAALLGGRAVAHPAPTRSGRTEAGRAAVSLGDQRLRIEFDRNLQSRLEHLPAAGAAPMELAAWTAADYLLLADGARLDRFTLREHAQQHIDGALGAGTRLRLRGLSKSALRIEKTVELELFERYPGLLLYRVGYRNLGAAPLAIGGWTNAAFRLRAASPGEAAPGETSPDEAAPGEVHEPPFWSYCGSSHEDRRDWVQPVRAGFRQLNFMGMEASDYGGGTPIVDVWRRDCGLAIGHLEQTPELVSLPVNCDASGVGLALTKALERTLPPGEGIETHQTLIAAHRGDYFVVLDAYRRIMADRGVASPSAPAAAYEPIWCAWGYERACTRELIEGTLPKVRDLGLSWAVIDDGWQNTIGDWGLDPAKYPRGEADMVQLVERIRAQELKPRLWWTPLAAAPGSELLRDHTGAPQAISWWNCFYLCPAHAPTVDYTLELVRKFIGRWGYAGLKVDGQHLNGVAPCFNPAHRHARPEESVEKLQDFLQAIYQTALSLKPDAVVELCPCGTAYSFFNMRSFNQAPASDPESSWQVRLKGKTLKALMGPSAAFAGDHVELSDGGDDFASTVGVGGIISTKFTWPRDPKPKDSFLLTPEREALWRKWITLYNERQLPKGSYRGELYDIGFDKPETHVVEKSGRFYYAFYAREFRGTVPLRGLGGGRYRLRDYFNARDLGEVTGPKPSVALDFRGALLLEAVAV